MTSNDLVNLNVGGTIYTTTKSTLLRPRGPKSAETFFHALFSGRFPLSQDVNGNIFIDRDGALFRHVLNFCRTGKWFDHCLSPFEKEALEEEAAFFLLKAPPVSGGAIPNDRELLEYNAKTKMEIAEKSYQKNIALWTVVEGSIKAAFNNAEQNGAPWPSTGFPIGPLFLCKNYAAVMGNFIIPFWEKTLDRDPLELESSKQITLVALKKSLDSVGLWFGDFTYYELIEKGEAEGFLTVFAKQTGLKLKIIPAYCRPSPHRLMTCTLVASQNEAEGKAVRIGFTFAPSNFFGDLFLTKQYV
jgi:hypothetical protein